MLRTIPCVVLPVLLFGPGCCDPSARAPRATGTLVLETEAIEGAVDGAAIDALVATEIQVIQSEDVRRRVVDEYALLEPFGATEEEAVVGLAGALEVRRVDESTVVEVAVIAEDPQLAQEVCNGVMVAYLEHRMDLRRRPFDEQLDWLMVQLSDLDGELADPALTDAGERAQKQALRDQLVERVNAASLEATLLDNDARVLEYCLMPKGS